MSDTTQRGFRIFGRFESDAGRPVPVRVQESSVALRGPCVWVYHGPPDQEVWLHLDLAGARALDASLQVFIEEAEQGQLTEPIENIP